MSAKEYDMSRVEQMAELTPEEFARMLIDLIAWFNFAKRVQRIDPSAVSHGFLWRDDGDSGAISSVILNGQEVDLSGGAA